MAAVFQGSSLLLLSSFVFGTSEFALECFDDDEHVSLLQTVAEKQAYEFRHGPSPRIPRTLILMGNADSIAELDDAVRANVQKAIHLNKDLRLRWLSDAMCDEYLEKHDSELRLMEAFRRERRGSFRGDICRAAVLLLEGGFYQDIDVELRVPFHALTNDSTSFMAMWEADGKNILNAVIAIEPGSALMARTVDHIRSWYTESHSDQEGWMGPATFTGGVKAVLQQDCPSVNLMQTRDRFQRDLSCGHHNLRFYQEEQLPCDTSLVVSDADSARGCSQFDGLRFAFFGGIQTRTLVGWPRFANCKEYGCHAGGWEVARRFGGEILEARR